MSVSVDIINGCVINASGVEKYPVIHKK